MMRPAVSSQSRPAAASTSLFASMLSAAALLSVSILVPVSPSWSQPTKKPSAFLVELQELSKVLDKAEDYTALKSASEEFRIRLKNKTLVGTDTEKKFAKCLENFIAPVLTDTENYAKHSERMKAEDFFDLRIYAKSKKLLEQDAAEIEQMSKATSSLIGRAKSLETNFRKACENAGVTKAVADEEIASNSAAFRELAGNKSGAELDLEISTELKSIIDLLISAWGKWKIEAGEDGEDEISFDDPKVESKYEAHMARFEKLTEKNQTPPPPQSE